MLVSCQRTPTEEINTNHLRCPEAKLTKPDTEYLKISELSKEWLPFAVPFQKRCPHNSVHPVNWLLWWPLVTWWPLVLMEKNELYEVMAKTHDVGSVLEPVAIKPMNRMFLEPR